ncbi:MAG: ABC transporter permease subunit [Oscillospiraceae bacterium]
MKTSSLFNRKLYKTLFALVFWLALWQIISMMVGTEFLVPSPSKTLEALGALAMKKEFWLSCLYSLIRIILGFSLAIICGTVIAALTHKLSFVNTLLSPVLHIIKAAPVASFIILALVWIKTDTLPIFISFLMVVPIVWQTVHTSLANIDKKEIEMGKVFGFNKWKILKFIIIPQIMPQFVSSAITSLGFAWKSGVAAEIICLPEISLGRQLQNSKAHLETPDVFALTATIIILSLILEKLLQFMAERYLEKRRAVSENL